MDTHLHDDGTKIKYLSWRAVLVGALVAFGLIFLFNILTIGVGLSTYTKTEQGNEILIAIAYIWTLIGSFVMLFIGGFVAGRILTRCHPSSGCNAVVNGFVTWVFYILITLTFLSHLTEATLVVSPSTFANITTSRLTEGLGSETITSRSSTSSSAHSSEQRTSTQKAVHKIGLATLASFFVFFVEAIGACFGAWCGINIIRRC